MSRFEICAREICEKFVYKHFETIIICQKLAYVEINLQTSRANNMRVLGNKNAKISGDCFCKNINI